MRSLILFLVVLVLGVAVWFFYRSGGLAESMKTVTVGVEGLEGSHFDMSTELVTTCSTCHVLPPADVLPRARWRRTIELMYQEAEDRLVDMPAEMEEAVAYYEAAAPERFPEMTGRTDAGAGRGFWWRLDWRPDISAGGLESDPAVSNLVFEDLFGGPELELLGTDMRSGMVFVMRPYDPDAGVEVLAMAKHPSHVEVCDLDGDGIKDLLVADLGVWLPSDEKQGGVLWVRGLGDGLYETIELASGLGRVADVRAGDLDGDGDVDIAVAVFGWHAVGEVMWLENNSLSGDETPIFSAHTLDARSGAINVPIVDIDNDGDLDIVAVLAQEHEQVMAYVREDGVFEARELYRAPHPAWGTSGIEPVDIDGDGDLDIIMTHGDSLEGFFLRSYHGVDLLMNEDAQALRFTRKSLTPMHGAMRAMPVDLDADGDLDIVAVGYLPNPTKEVEEGPLKMEGVLWMEQTRSGWVRRVLQQGQTNNPSLAVGDYNRDGLDDFAVGHMRYVSGEWTPLDHWVTLWRNGRVSRMTQGGSSGAVKVLP